ncbi:uncharacterized protein LOC100202260 isoform X1 [Hydra vulgaris]|nr:uncharacterized protein LOC100202260 isoform X2 [Hydra vulgaris]
MYKKTGSYRWDKNKSFHRRDDTSCRQLDEKLIELKEKWLFKNKKELIKNFEKNDITLNSNGFVDNFVSVGSYNWALQSTPDKPVIIVPGIPNYIKENLLCQKLKKSDVQRVCDENQYYMSRHPMEPMFQAVLLCTPEYDFSSVDLITDRINLRKLFEFVEGNSKDSFRIDIQMNENDTLMFIRNDENVILPCQDYSIDFKNKFTENGSPEAGSYWNIVTYMLGSIRVMCQAQVDCVEKNSCLGQAELLPKKTEPIAFDESSKLMLIEGGDFDNQKYEKFIELTTKGIYDNNFEFPTNKWSHLLFFNINLMVFGWHERGVLKKIEKISFEEVSKRCDRKKEDYQQSLGKLCSLITMIKEKIKSCAEHKSGFAVVFDSNNDKQSLELFTVCNNFDVLTPGLKMRVFK